MTRTETPCGGAGENAERGIGAPIEQLNSRLQRPAPGAPPDAQRCAVCHGTMTSAWRSRLPGAVRRRSSATEIAKGGFATTRKGRRGRRTSLASAWTTMTSSSANVVRSSRARVGCSSKAMTRAPRRTSGPVIAPVPAPMSSTRSPGRMPARSTSRSAHWLSSRCHPHRVRSPGTADHREHCHATTVGDETPFVNEQPRARSDARRRIRRRSRHRCRCRHWTRLARPVAGRISRRLPRAP